jgi:orc1/cdc6 family replication initiation protein
MIQNARVLQDDFTPREIVHRDAEINDIARALKPITDGDPGEETFLFGPSGAGKTCIANHSVTRLQEQAFNVETHYVNCWRNYTRFRALYEVADGIGQTLDIHPQATPMSDLLDRLRNYDDGQYVVILDEVDQLEEMDLLYDLHEIRNLTMVMIANQEEEVFAQLEDRVQSRLTGARRIRFDKYSDEEIMTILSDRVNWGLRQDAISEEELSLIADIAAGDARKAINILRLAARDAWDNDRDQITLTNIREAVPEAKQAIRERSRDKLTTNQELILEIIEDAGEIGMGELYAKYETTTEDPKTQRGIRNDLQKMIRYNLIEAEGENRGRTYRPIETAG